MCIIRFLRNIFKHNNLNITPMKPQTVYKSAITGRFVSKEYAMENKDTTVEITIHKHKDELIGFANYLFPENIGKKNVRLVNEYLENKKDTDWI